MQSWLVFQLYGPLASWGGVAVGEVRASETHPGRSALIGLLAAALGIRRDEEQRLAELGQACRFAVEVRTSGHHLRDYHTAQVPDQGILNKLNVRTRRDELNVDKDRLGTILSVRDYRCDAYYRVVVEVNGSGEWTLEHFHSALHSPRLPLYLGRKSCPLALPMSPQIVKATSIVDALTKAPVEGPDSIAPSARRHERHRIDTDPPYSLYWEDGMESGISTEQTYTRRDQPRTRSRWQFDQRQEHHARITGGE